MGTRTKSKDRISNWGRFQSIVKVLGKHGFTSFLHELDLPFPLPFKRKTDLNNESIPQHLRQAFEELGPTFIKLGQILSTRPDLLPPEYIQEFSLLTDDVPSIAFSSVTEIVEQEFARPHSEVFEWIEEEPIAAASISQVHRARLNTGENRDVVLKVQRPDIEKNIQSDIQILYFFAQALEKIREEFRLYNLTAIVEEFQRSIYEELDFSLEAKNIEAFSSNLREIEGIVLPEVIWELSSKRVLTMTEIKGTNLSRLQEFPDNIDRTFLSESVAQFFLESMFVHGLFHCDAHSGNLIVQTEGRGKVGIIDFGMVGRIGPDLREKMSRIFLALVTRDFESLAYLYTEVAEFGKRFSVRDFKRDIERLLGPSLSKPLHEIDVGQMMLDSVSLAHKYQVRLPRDLILFYRSVVTLEHCCRKLDPQFTFIDFGTKFSKLLLQRRFSPEALGRDFIRIIEGFRSLGTEMPAQLKSLMNRIEESDGFGMSANFTDGLKTFRRSNQSLSLAIICFGCVLGASVLTGLRPESFILLPLWLMGLLSFLLSLYFGLRK